MPACIEAGNLRDIDPNAFLVAQTIEINQFPRHIIAIREGCEKVAWQHYRRDDLHTLVEYVENVSGINVYLITNDIALILKLAGAGFNPPCPWIAFYEPGPAMGFMPGNPEHDWYHKIWNQYWEALTLVEQDKFLKRKRQETVAYMPDDEWKDWVKGIRLRDPGTREHIESGTDPLSIPGSTSED